MTLPLSHPLHKTLTTVIHDSCTRITHRKFGYCTRQHGNELSTKQIWAWQNSPLSNMYNPSTRSPRRGGKYVPNISAPGNWKPSCNGRTILNTHLPVNRSPLKSDIGTLSKRTSVTVTRAADHPHGLLRFSQKTKSEAQAHGILRSFIPSTGRMCSAANIGQSSITVQSQSLASSRQ